MNDQEEAVKLLLENSSTDVTVEADNGLGINGFTILMWEVRNGHEETVKMLLQNSEIDVNAGEVNCTFIKDTVNKTEYPSASKCPARLIIKTIF